MGVPSSARLPLRFWALISATFLGFLGFGAVLPELAPHVRYDLGGSDRTVGFVIGTFSVVALGSRVISGKLVDRKGRKLSFMIGLTSCATAGLAYLLPFGVAGMYLGRALQGFGEACLYTGCAAWAVELAGVERSARALGFVSTGIWGGVTCGPVVGQWLGPFQHAAIFQVISATTSLLLLTRVPEDYKPHPDKAPRKWLQPYLLWPGIAVGFTNVHYPVITGFLILHLASHGDSGRTAFSVYAGFVLLSRFFLGGLPDRISAHITYFIGLVFMAVGLSVLAVGPGPALAIVGAGLLGFGFSFPWASVASTVLKKTENQDRGSAVSVLSAFYDLFVGMSSFSAGIVANKWGYASTFVMATVALGAAAVAGRFVFFGDSRREEVFAAEAPEESLSH